MFKFLEGDVLEEKAIAIYPRWRDIIEAKRIHLPRRCLNKTLLLNIESSTIQDLLLLHEAISDPNQYLDTMGWYLSAESIAFLTEIKQPGVPLAVDELVICFED